MSVTFNLLKDITIDNWSWNEDTLQYEDGTVWKGIYVQGQLPIDVRETKDKLKKISNLVHDKNLAMALTGSCAVTIGFEIKRTPRDKLEKKLMVYVCGSPIDKIMDGMYKAVPKLKVSVKLTAQDDKNSQIKIISPEIEAVHKRMIYSAKYTFEHCVPLVESRSWKDRPFDGKVNVKLIISEADVLGLQLPSSQQMYKGLFEQQLHTDFALVADNGTGARIPCNKVILANRSPVFQRMLATNMTETKSEACMMSMSEAGVNAFLKYMYYCDIDDPLRDPTIALELLEAGHKYDITDLESVLKQMFMKKTKDEWRAADVSLKLFLWTLNVPGHEDMKQHAVQMMKS